MILLEGGGRHASRGELNRIIGHGLELDLPINEFSGFLGVGDSEWGLLQFFHFLKQRSTHCCDPFI